MRDLMDFRDCRVTESTNALKVFPERELTKPRRRLAEDEAATQFQRETHVTVWRYRATSFARTFFSLSERLKKRRTDLPTPQQAVNPRRGGSTPAIASARP